MATVSLAKGTERGELRFFFTLACVMVAIILAGFSFNIATGRSSFAAPWLVHFHAWAMMAWLGLYLAQNALVSGGNVALHRRLGWLAAILLPVILVLGILVTRYSLQSVGGPPFFDQNQFLFSNPLQLIGFVGTAAWAISVRRNTAWHRRLMFCAMASLVGPGIGRLLPMPFLIPYAWYVAIGLPLLFPVIGAFVDKRRDGRVHPAWLWGIGVVVGIQILADLMAYSDAGIAFTEQFLAGTPGAARQMEAFFPSM